MFKFLFTLSRSIKPVNLLRMSEEVKKQVESLISEHHVMVFSKTYCSYCSNTKRILEEECIDFYALELDKIDNGNEIQGFLFEKTSQRTVPNIFIGGKHIGGNSDLEALRTKGELKLYLK
ncbi:glutaredoxin [Pneumocystis murina B123]|uniref:Glutaredoxin n=1 Tax=Pneumocystis murina (strain B123) TaxID=1069680 RepID=M7P3D2_PNEMU|nr:glutaredoxin [Pneumocystis murina B123]EMR08330.1 glutaredoxin [Pneumocystis murina B123]